MLKEMMNDFLLIKPNEVSTIKKTDSGFFLVEHLEDSRNNFDKIFIENQPTTTHSQKNALINYSLKKNGLINTIGNSADVNIGLLEENKSMNEFIKGGKSNSGVVKKINKTVSFISCEDHVVYKKEHENLLFEDCVVVRDKNILAKKIDNKYIPHPNRVIVKITKQDRDALFSKKIITQSGEEKNLFIALPPDTIDENHSQFFVSTGIVQSVGENVESVKVGDIAIIDYMADNDETIIVGYEGKDKLISVNAVTTQHQEDYIIYANRKTGSTRRDTVIWKRGDYDELSQLVGVVSNENLTAIYPYVFLEHLPFDELRRTKSGIEYNVKLDSATRKVLSCSSKTTKTFSINNEERVIVFDRDIFTVKNGNVFIDCIFDFEIVANENILNSIKKTTFRKKVLKVQK